jgi:hypothetical protein
VEVRPGQRTTANRASDGKRLLAKGSISMTQTTARPAQLAPVRIGNGKEVHLGHLSSIKGPNGEPRYCSYCPASRVRMDKTVAGEAIAEEITCKSCQRQAGAEALERAAETAEAMIQAALPNREYDHDGQCIGCGAFSGPALTFSGQRGDEPCAPDCGFETGQVSAAMVLRAAARRLDQFARGHGADIRAAFDAGAVALMRTERTRGAGEDLYVEDLVDAAHDAMGAYLDELAGPDPELPGASLVDEYGVLVPRRQLAEALYLAADRNDGFPVEAVHRERLIGDALRELDRCCPGAEILLVAVNGPEAGPQEVEFLGTKNPDELYVSFGWIDTADEDAFNKAGELIVRALSISMPPYLRPSDDGNATHELAIEDTTYGKTLRR